MGSLIAEAFNPSLAPRASWGPTDERWYVKDISGYIAEVNGGAGIPVTTETLKRCMAILGALRFLGNSVAVCKPHVIEEQPDGTRRPAPRTHPASRVLRRPDAAMNTFRWVHSQVFKAALYGNAHSHVLPGRATFAGALRPMMPGSCRVKGRRRPSGELQYEWDGRYEGDDSMAGATTVIGQEEVFHLRGVTSDGISGEPINKLISNAVAIGLAAERHTATFLRKGARIAGLLVPSAPLNPEQRKTLTDSVNADFGDINNTGTLGVLPYGVDLKELSKSNRDSQLLELRDFQVGDALRGIGVPGIMVGYGEKVATYASAKEFYESGGLKHCVLPWVENFEAELEFCLLLDDEPYQIKFNMDILSRPSTWQRIEMLTKAAGRPFMTGNEARTIWDLNPVAQADMDEVAQPSNMVGSEPAEQRRQGQASEPRPQKPTEPEPLDDESEQDLHTTPVATDGAIAMRLAQASASRLVRRELAALAAKGPRFARDTNGWRGFVLDFYGRHEQVVAEALGVGIAQARAYCNGQASWVLAANFAGIARMESDATQRLIGLALGKEHA